MLNLSQQWSRLGKFCIAEHCKGCWRINVNTLHKYTHSDWKLLSPRFSYFQPNLPNKWYCSLNPGAMLLVLEILLDATMSNCVWYQVTVYYSIEHYWRQQLVWEGTSAIFQQSCRILIINNLTDNILSFFIIAAMTEINMDRQLHSLSLKPTWWEKMSWKQNLKNKFTKN